VGLRLLALDMDGTLLTSEKTVSRQTQEALCRLADRGVALAFCTGRNADEALWSLGGTCGPIRYGVLVSGVLTYDFRTKRTLEAHPIAPQVAEKIVKAAQAEDAMPALIYPDACICREEDAGHMDLFHMGIYQSMYQGVYHFADDLLGYIADHPSDIVKVEVYHRSAASRVRTRRRIESLGVRMADAETTSLECSAEGISKAKGLEALSHELDIPLSDMAVAGDAPNDLDALKAAGCAIAMGNATPEIMDVADIVVADNDHDGIAEAALRLFGV
jgi:Cof subfamily protein (haloacid dehalogenase superfamily)